MLAEVQLSWLSAGQLQGNSEIPYTAAFALKH